MSRRHRAEKRKVLKDPIYGEEMVGKFINCLMLDGEKSVSESIFYSALDTIKKETSKDPIEYFKQAIDNVKPSLEVASRRVGGATYQVPMPVNAHRARILTYRWIIGIARKRREYTMVDRLAKELMDAYNKRGLSIKKKEDTHKMAEANRAFAHYRW